MADVQTAKTFQFDLVSPEKVIVSEQASMVVVPGEAGDFGVLAGHSPLLSTLRPGVVTVTSPSGEVRKIFVASGFADVNGTLCSVLAEEAVNLNDLDRGALEQSLRALEETAEKTAQTRRDIEVTRAKLAAIQ